ncbi:MAG: protein kinase, partial [Acidobacteria bacterium]|nr:protein kinase [Acidobacteriota bacterium]
MRRSSRARVDSNLTPEAWRQLEDLLDHALDLPEAERVAFLGRSCGTGPIRNQLESLLAAHEETEGPLERLAQDLRQFPLQAPLDAPGPGERVGSYELLEVIGQGGMGVVYRAQRADGEFQQEVALKLIRNPLSDPAAGKRFLAERQILALISHPNVARLLDGGLTQTGHPFFTMELVQGDPL